MRLRNVLVVVLAAAPLSGLTAGAEDDPITSAGEPVTTIDRREIENLPTLGVDKLALLIPISKPVGPFGDVANTGLGIGMQLSHRVNDNLSIVFGAGVDRFGAKEEDTPNRETGTISSEYGYGGLELDLIKRVEVVRGPSGTQYGNSPSAGVLVAVGMTGFDAKIDFAAADATVHFSENALGVVAGIFYEHPVSESGAVRAQVTGNHAFSTQGDSRISLTAGYIHRPWKGWRNESLGGPIVRDRTFLFSKLNIEVGPSCMYPSFGRYADEVAHGFGINGRLTYDVTLPFGLSDPYVSNPPLANGALYLGVSRGFLKPTLEYDVDGIDEKAGSTGIDLGMQFFVKPNENVIPYLQASVGYQQVTNERTSTFPQLPSYDHNESGFNVRVGFGARTRISSKLALNLSLDTPALSFGYDEHDEPGWRKYKPNETRMHAGLQFALTRR